MSSPTSPVSNPPGSDTNSALQTGSSARSTGSLTIATSTFSSSSLSTSAKISQPAETSISLSTGGSTNAGAIAGAAVGCFAGGLALGLIIAWLLLRRRKQSEARFTEVADVTELKDHPPMNTTTMSNGTSAIGTIALDQFLLDGAPDEDVVMELRALGDLICQHVESYYHLRETRVQEASLSRLILDLRFDQDWGVNAETVAALCINPKTRYVGLRHVISSVVFRSIDIDSRYPISMLPTPIAAFLQAVPPAESHRSNSSAMGLAASQWRRLSALLLHPDPSDRVPLKVSEADVAPQAADLANTLNRFLLHFVPADPPAQNEQTSHLQALIIECTKLGYALFSHPCDWAFVFRNNVSSQGQGIVVCAGLNKHSHRDGKRYKTPKCIVEPSELVV